MDNFREMCKVGRLDEAVQVIDLMFKKGMPISREMVYNLLQACSKNKDLSITRRMHSLMVDSPLDIVSILRDQLIRLFATCGSLHEASLVFGKVAKPSAYTWQAIISAHASLGESEGAFELYDKMTCEGFKPDKFILSSILKACSSARALARGELIHEQIVEHGLGSDVIIGSILVDMYAKCGCLEKACNVFDEMPTRDKVTWNSMIAAYVHHGYGSVALDLYKTMQQEGVKPDKVTYLGLLKACGIIGDFAQGKVIHDHIMRSALESDLVVGSTLVDMYAKCGSLGEAHKVFDSLHDQNLVSWSALITGYVNNGEGQTALVLFEKMQQKGIKPDKVTFTSILKACGSTGVVGQGKLIHEQVVESGFESDVVVGNTLFDMYAKCGSLEEARKVFDTLPNRDVVSWSTMIAGYAQHGHGFSALELYDKMQQKGVWLDEVTYSSVLKACSSIGAIGPGKLIHDQFLGEFQSDAVVGNTLIDMYAKCGNLKLARKVFDESHNRNVISWNVLITAYAQHGQPFLAFDLFNKMQVEGIEPTKVTYLGILKACASVGAIPCGELIHALIFRNGFASDRMIGNALVDMYAKCKRLEVARQVFDDLQNRDAVSWGAMIGGYVQNGHGLAALDLFKKMQLEGIIKPDNVTILTILKACGSLGAAGQGELLHEYMIETGIVLDLLVGNALVDMYAKCGSMEKARKLFNNLPNRDVVSWNAMISGYTFHGNGFCALELFENMQQQGIRPDKVTFLCILKACGSIAAIEQGKLLHEQIIKRGFSLDAATGNALVDMYAKCGSLEEAKDVFDKSLHKDIVSWGAMIEGYGHHSKCSLARQCLDNMQEQGLRPDGPIYMSILAACSQAGLVDEGYEYFYSMNADHGITPSIEHFNCLLDLLGRAGRLKEAEELLQTMPGLPSLPAWMSLLSACRLYGNVELGRCCFNQVFQLDPNSAAGYSIMSNIYADALMWNNVQEIQELRKYSGAWKTPGTACIEVDGKMHDFIVGDETHLENHFVHAKIRRLQDQIKQAAYMPQLGTLEIAW